MNTPTKTNRLGSWLMVATSSLLLVIVGYYFIIFFPVGSALLILPGIAYSIMLIFARKTFVGYRPGILFLTLYILSNACISLFALFLAMGFALGTTHDIQGGGVVLVFIVLLLLYLVGALLIPPTGPVRQN